MFDSQFDSQSDAMQACFVFGDVVGCRKEDPKDVAEFVLVWRNEKYSGTSSIDVQGSVEEH